MKRIKIAILAVMIVTGLGLSIITATASAFDCAECQIKRLGMYPGQFGTTDGFMVQVDDLSDTGWTGIRTFYLNDTLGKAGWATVLTGYSLNKTLWLRIIDTEPGSLITIVHIND